MDAIVAADGTGGGDSAVVNEAIVDARLRFAFELCFSRGGTDAELARLRTLYTDARAEFNRDVEAAKKVLGRSPPEELPAAEAAAWFVVARALMNLDEFITRE
jgi:hypothetical protein